MARFTLPRDLYHGPNALEALKTLPGKRAMICVGGGSMKRFGFLDKAEQYLKEAGMEVVETDCAEAILQTAKDHPSHIVVPALHLDREAIARMMQEED